MSDRVARRRSRTRERIFTEAIRLFAERGFHETTVADIAAAADIGKGTFFTHFPTKGDVFRYLGEQVVAVMGDSAAATRGQPVAIRLGALLAAAATWLEASADVARQAVRARSFTIGADADSPSQGRLHALLTELVTDAQDAGEVRSDVAAEDAALALATAYLSHVVMWALDPARPLADRFEAALDLALRGLTP